MQGYSVAFHKRTTQDQFDGSATAKTLWLKGSAVCNICVSAGLNVDGSAVARGYLLVKLEYYSGARWTGSAWTGGAWTELWSGDIVVYSGATATKDTNSPQVHSILFANPMKVPYEPSIEKPPGSPDAGTWTAPNTHAGTEVATETDLRLYTTLVAGNAVGTALAMSATVTMAM